MIVVHFPRNFHGHQWIDRNPLLTAILAMPGGWLRRIRGVDRPAYGISVTSVRALGYAIPDMTPSDYWASLVSGFPEEFTRVFTTMEWSE